MAEYQDPGTIKRILSDSKTIAVVGLSDKPDRPSYGVAAYLQSQGYRIIPVNPRISEVLGEKSYPDLESVPEDIDVVDVFRRSEDVPAIAESSISRGVKAVWLQEGVINEEAAKQISESGIAVVMDLCMFKEHNKYAP